MPELENSVLRDAAILQVIAGELSGGHRPDAERLAELARAINMVASDLLATQARSVRV